MAALLTSEMGNTDKMVGYFTECRERGIPILPPDVNESQKNFTVVEGGIRFGLAAIKNVGGSAIESVIASREAEGPFSSFFDFCCRIDLHKANKRVIEGLIKVGAFDSMGAKRAQLTAVMEQTLDEANAIQKERALGQTSLFGTGEAGGSNPDALTRPLPSIDEWQQAQILQFERELTGFYITAHPLAQHAEAIRLLSTHNTATLHEAHEGREIKICGVIGSVKVTTTKKGNRMAYVQMEDLQGLVEIIVFPELFQSCAEFLNADTVIQAAGTVDHMDTGARLKATKLEPLNDLQAKTVKRVIVQLAETPATWGKLPKLHEVLHRHPGPAPVAFHFHLDSQVQAESAPLPNLGVLPSSNLVYEVEQILGKETVTFQ